MAQVKLTKRRIDALKAGADRYTIWDTDVSGFGLRVTPAGDRSYVLKYRVARQQRWFTIGRHGSPWTPEAARKRAKSLLGDVSKGIDPGAARDADRRATTIAELCDLYLLEGVAHKKESTLKADRARIKHHLKPLLGKKRVDTIGRGDIERLLNDVTNGKTAADEPKEGERAAGSIPTGGAGVAAQCVTLVGTVLAFAVKRGLRQDNPAHGVKKTPVRKMERFLSEVEIARLAQALDGEAAATGNPYPSAAIKLLLLTGCRRGEVLGLLWQHVDFERHCLNLPDSKTGKKVVYINAPVLALLEKLPRVDGNSHVFCGGRAKSAARNSGKKIEKKQFKAPLPLLGKKRVDSPLIGLDKIWFRVRAKAKLNDVRLHDLRHSFASVGAMGGLSLPIIGALLGHKHSMTTARYAHLSADPIRAANEAVGARIAAAMTGMPEAKTVVPLRRSS